MVQGKHQQNLKSLINLPYKISYIVDWQFSIEKTLLLEKAERVELGESQP